MSNTGQPMSARALLDSGSQVNIITEQCVQRMGLRKTTCNIQAQGLGASTKIRFTGTVIATLLSRIEPIFVMRCSMYVIPKITAYLPTKSITQEQIAATSKLNLADQQFHMPAKIEILLGSGVWAEIIKGEVEKHTSGLTAQYTSFGWILLGQMRENSNTARATLTTMWTAESPDEHLNELLRRFWEVEELHSPTPMSAEDEWVEQNFQNTHWRDTSGRYVVTIPINPQAQGLGSSRAVAVRRFHQLEKRLSVNSELKEKYVDFMREYEQLGHMEIATSEPKTNDNVYYIYASCKSDNGTSLNDMQFHGPKLQEDLSVILTRFRSYKVAVNADIRKMFRQVRVDPKQWDLQRIFWRENPNEELHEYWLTVVTYGMASSGFNAVRAMIQCARDNKEAYPLAHQAIATNFYMDDMLTGADTEQDAVDLAKEIAASLKTGGFELDKFASSSARVLSVFVNTVSDNTEHAFPAEPGTSILGLYWDSSTDELHFKVHQSEAKSKFTKRAVVSAVARLYDPNGYLAPVIICAKIIIQDLWRSGVHWDKPIPIEHEPAWRKFREQLEHLTSVRVPRWLGSEEASTLELHGFADASERAYAAVVYLRSASDKVGTKCILVASKTRVSPLKTLTIPRLELCAADLLCKLMSQVIQAGSFQNVTRIYWSDSMVALHWIAKLPHELKPFVSNRVKSIQQLSSGHPWRHVTSADNPADLGSRGIAAEQLKDAKLWWQGPPWLSKAEQHWPTVPMQLSAKQKERAEKEAKAITIACLTITTSQGLDIDGIALIDRLKQHKELRPHRTMSHVPVLSVVERERALTYWVKSAQQEAYRRAS